MKKYLLVPFLFPFSLFGQMDSVANSGPTKTNNKPVFCDRPVIEPTYSIYVLRNAVNTSNDPLFDRIEKNYQAIGININLYGSGDVGFFGLIADKEVTLQLNYFLPITLNSNDTLFHKFNGYNFSINYGKDIFLSNRTFDLIPSYGYGFSSVTLRRKINTNEIKYRNPGFIFNLMLESRINLINYKDYKRLSLGIKGGYQIDCSKTSWRTSNKTTSELSGYRQTGAFAQGFVGIRL